MRRFCFFMKRSALDDYSIHQKDNLDLSTDVSLCKLYQCYAELRGHLSPMNTSRRAGIPFVPSDALSSIPDADLQQGRK
jgi:hypothetical protein